MSYHLNRQLFDKNGEATEDEKLACAKIVSKDLSDGPLGTKRTVCKYFVKYAGYLYDPVQMSEVDARYRNWQMKEVNQRAYDMYYQFLVTKKEHFRINAERLINV